MNKSKLLSLTVVVIFAVGILAFNLPISATGWLNQDIGDAGIAGSASETGGTWSVKGSGEDVWGSDDAFHYVYQSLSGDGEISARVVSMADGNPYWQKAGVMIRETLGPSSKNVAALLTGTNGVKLQRRDGSSSVINGSSSQAPHWLKLVRSGDTFTGYESTDGSAWTLIGSYTVSMSADVYLGMAVTAKDNTKLATAVFDNVVTSLSPTPTPTPTPTGPTPTPTPTPTPAPTPTTPVKLILSPGMMINESLQGGGDPTRLVDEQALAGDPPSGNNCTTRWEVHHSWEFVFPIMGHIDLGQEYNLSTIWMHDTYSKGYFKVEYGSPGNWTELLTVYTDKYLFWREIPVNVTTQFLRFTQLDSDAMLNEICLYGTPTGAGDITAPLKATGFHATAWNGKVSLSWRDPTQDCSGTRIVRKTGSYPTGPTDGTIIYNGTGETFLDTGVSNDGTQYYYAAFAYDEASNFADPSTAAATPALTPQAVSDPILIKGFLGTNAFVDDPLDKLSAVGFIREYHSWRWDETDDPNYPGYPNNENKFNPSYAGGGWDFDTYYTNLVNAGIEVSLCMQGTVGWITYPIDFAARPLSPGEDPLDPASYIEHGDHMYQYAARYASVAVPDGNLKLAGDQQRLTGLSLIKYYENWNEPNNWWSGDKEAHMFSPEEFAAMSSADYDGHQGTLGSHIGIKNADPNAKLVLGGLAGLQKWWLPRLQAWADANRGGDLPVDVLNFHEYCYNDTTGISPEDFNFKEKMEEIIAYRDIYMPDKEVWVSEFGWDTNTGSPQSAPTHLAQAQWIVRGYLALLGARTDRAQQYMLRDGNPDSPGKFKSSGLTSPKYDWIPKISWYFVYTMKNRLGDMIFDTEVASGNSNVEIYRLRDNDTYSGAYVLWCPTSDGTTVNNYQLGLMDGTTSATLINLVEGDTDGVPTALTIQNGTVTVDVSETPIFVLFD